VPERGIQILSCWVISRIVGPPFSFSKKDLLIQFRQTASHWLLQARPYERRYDTQITDLTQSHSFQRHGRSSTILHSQGVDCPNRTPSDIGSITQKPGRRPFLKRVRRICWLKIHHLIALLHKQIPPLPKKSLTRAGEAPLPNCASLCWTWKQLHQGITRQVATAASLSLLHASLLSEGVCSNRITHLLFLP